MQGYIRQQPIGRIALFRTAFLRRSHVPSEHLFGLSKPTFVRSSLGRVISGREGPELLVQSIDLGLHCFRYAPISGFVYRAERVPVWRPKTNVFLQWECRMFYARHLHT